SQYDKTVQDLVQSKQAATTVADRFKTGLTAVQQVVQGNVSGVQELAGVVGTDLVGGFAAAGGAAAAMVTTLVGVGLALYELAEHAAAVGGTLNDLSDKTGIAVPTLSRLSNAADVAGTDITTLSNAVFVMQRQMAEGSEKFVTGLSRINMSFEE